MATGETTYALATASRSMKVEIVTKATTRTMNAMDWVFSYGPTATNTWAISRKVIYALRCALDVKPWHVTLSSILPPLDHSTSTGVIHGHGRYEWNDGNVYVGDWQRGQMTGEGFLIKFNAQEELRGTFVNGLLHGWGKKQWNNGNSYEGHFREGIQHGYGTMTVANHPHHVFEGMWQDDTLAGLGRFVIYNKDSRGRTKQTTW